MKNVIVGQSGGPTAVINSSLVGVYETAKSLGVPKVYGCLLYTSFLGIRLSVTRDDDSEGDISQFGALTTALASTIGTGNIIGVGTAIALGGPGAVFWCWLTGVLGIATKYAESLVAQKYRVKTRDGRVLGGAMYALERGLGLKWLACLFALFTALATFGIGCSVQVRCV